MTSSITFVDGIASAVELTHRFAEGHVLTQRQARLLNSILIDRLRARMTWRVNRGAIARETVQADALRMYESMDFASADDIADIDVDDVITAEARAIAREVITTQLARDGYAVPKNIDDHAAELASASAEIRAKAKLRVELRRSVALGAVERL